MERISKFLRKFGEPLPQIPVWGLGLLPSLKPWHKTHQPLHGSYSPLSKITSVTSTKALQSVQRLKCHILSRTKRTFWPLF